VHLADKLIRIAHGISIAFGIRLERDPRDRFSGSMRVCNYFVSNSDIFEGNENLLHLLAQQLHLLRAWIAMGLEPTAVGLFW